MSLKKMLFVLLTGALCVIALCTNNSKKLVASATVSLGAVAEEVDQSSAGQHLGNYIDPNDGCIYYKISLLVSGNSAQTAHSATGFYFEYNSYIFEPVLYIPSGSTVEHVVYERGPAAGYLSIIDAFDLTHSKVGFASMGINNSVSENGYFVSFLLKTKVGMSWVDVGLNKILTDFSIDSWGGDYSTPIPFTQSQYYTHAVTRVIGDINGNGVSDLVDAQLLTQLLQSNSYSVTTDISALRSLFASAGGAYDHLFVIVNGTGYFLVDVVNVDQNGFVNDDDATEILHAYLQALIGDPDSYIGQEFTFTWNVAY